MSNKRGPNNDLFTDNHPENTIKGLQFKDGQSAWKSIQKIEKSRKTYKHKVQATLAMMQRAKYHYNKTRNIEIAENIYKKYLEVLKLRTIDKKSGNFTKSNKAKDKLWNMLQKRYD